MLKYNETKIKQNKAITTNKRTKQEFQFKNKPWIEKIYKELHEGALSQAAPKHIYIYIFSLRSRWSWSSLSEYLRYKWKWN